MDALASKTQELLGAVELLLRSQVLSRTGHINISARVDSDNFLLSSRGVAAALAQDTFVLVRHDGKVQHGELDATTAEIVSMHTAVYNARPSTGAILHTHSPFVTAFALAHKPLPVHYEPLLRHGQTVEVPVVAWAPRGSEALAAGMTATLTDSLNTSCLLLANHGLVAFAESPTAVAKLVLVLEEAAELESHAAALGGGQPLPADTRPKP